MSRASIVLAAVLAVTVTAREEARAELLSSRPITVVIPFTPGASSDTLQRIVDKKVTENTGQTLVVESRPGGSGVIAATVVKQAPPDGHTLLQANAGTHATNASLYATLPYDPIKDFRPITLMWSFSPVAFGPVRQPREVGRRPCRARQSEARGLELRLPGHRLRRTSARRDIQVEDRSEHGARSLSRCRACRDRSRRRPGRLLLCLLFVVAAVSAGRQGARYRGDVAAAPARAAGYPDDDGIRLCRCGARRLVRPRRTGRHARRRYRQAQCRLRAGGAGSECRQADDGARRRGGGHHAGGVRGVIASETERFARWCERSARRLSDYTDDEQSDAEAINSFAADGLRRSRGETRPHLPQKVAGTKQLPSASTTRRTSPIPRLKPMSFFSTG